MNLSLCKGRSGTLLKLTWINILVAFLATHAVADSARITSSLQRTGADTNATGLVKINLGQTNSTMTVLASNLTPARTYTVTVGGVRRATFVPAGNGRGQVRFAQPPTTGMVLFNFDPRGEQLAILQNETTVLRAVISGPGERRGSVVNESVSLARQAGLTGGGAEATYSLSATGTRRFTVSVTNVADGNWVLYVDGIRRGLIPVSGGSGSIAFDNDTTTTEPALNFDPRGLVVDVVRGASIFSRRFAARATGINLAKPSIQTRHIFSAGAGPTALARVERWTDRDARRGVDVELVNVPAGDYELFIDGVFKGFLPVFSTTSGNFGEMRFVTDPADEDEFLLDFSAFGSSYVVQVLGALFFAGQPISGIADPGVATTAPVRMDLPLLNLGADSDATARTHFQQDDRGSRRFEVIVRNLPAGEYALAVNGALVGVIPVVSTGSATRGVIEFEDEPEMDENILSFDPLGAIVTIERGTTRYFQRTLPANP